MVLAVAGMVGSLSVAVTPAAHSQSTEIQSMNEPVACHSLWLNDHTRADERRCRQKGWLVTWQIIVSADSRRAWTGWPPCPNEDSDECYWNAERRGNHDGRSFVNTRNLGVFFVDRINGRIA